MTLPPGVIERGEFRIDNSGMAAITRCTRYGWHQLAHRRVLAGRDSARGFGSAIHAAADVRQKLFGSGPYGPETLRAMDAEIERQYQGVELDADDHRTEGRAKEVVALYQAEHPEEPFDILASERSGERKLGIVRVPELGRLRGENCQHEWGEPDAYWKSQGHSLRQCLKCGGIRSDASRDIQYDNRYDEVTVLYQGRTDSIWRDRRHGRPAIKDLKTMCEGNIETEMLKYKLGPSLPGYCWLFSGAEFGEIRDAVIDIVIVRKPLVKPTPKSLSRTEFHRLPFTFADSQIEEWKRDTLKLIEGWLTFCTHPTEPPPMNRNACVQFKRACPYASVCENVSETDRMRWLESPQFRNYGWDAMTGRDDSEE
jgi:hypothetical protein